MKYLEDDKLNQWTSELTDAVLAGRVINARIEAFTMKRAGTDKKYAHALGEKYVAEMELEENQLAVSVAMNQKREVSRKRRSVSVDATSIESKEPTTKRSRAISFDESSGAVRPSPLGNFQEIGTRRLMTDLILTLNASFPDYDFANVRPFHFRKTTPKEAMDGASGRLSELASRRGESFLSKMWNAIDGCISLAETEVYTYVPPAIDEDPLGFLTQTLLEDGESATPLWSFNYFFVNKTLKRILLFSCIETMRSPEVSDEEDEQMVTVGRYKASEVDFDLDPSSDVAGGIPIAGI